MRKKIFILTILGFVIDQISKLLISKYNCNFNIIPNFFRIIYTKNTGVAFSMLSDSTIIIILISFALILFLFYELRKEKDDSKINVISYGLLFGGIFGNLVDRIVRGYVVDFISFKIFGYPFAIFNIADILITFGVILMIYKSIKEKSK